MGWSANKLVTKPKSIKMLNLLQSFMLRRQQEDILPKLAWKLISFRNPDVWLSASLLHQSVEMGQPLQFGMRLDGIKEKTAWQCHKIHMEGGASLARPVLPVPQH